MFLEVVILLLGAGGYKEKAAQVFDMCTLNGEMSRQDLILFLEKVFHVCLDYFPLLIKVWCYAQNDPIQTYRHILHEVKDETAARLTSILFSEEETLTKELF